MARARKRRRRSGDEIETILEEFDRSGLSQVGFARRRGLSVSTLRSWLDRRRRRLRRGREPQFVPVAISDSADSDRKWTPIPKQSGHAFRSKVDVHSCNSGHPSRGVDAD
jgi:hypothetical protein